MLVAEKWAANNEECPSLSEAPVRVVVFTTSIINIIIIIIYICSLFPRPKHENPTGPKGIWPVVVNVVVVNVLVVFLKT